MEVFGTDAKTFVHYASNSRGGIAAFSGQRIAITTTSIADDLVFGYNSNESSTSANFVERMRIDNGTGNVGIGTTLPDTKLHIYQSATNSQAYVTVQNNRSRNSAVFTKTTNGGFYTGTSIGTDTLCWQVYDASAGERMRISANGTVQIGASSTTNLSLGSSGSDFQLSAKKDGTDAINMVFKTQASGGTLAERIPYIS